MFNTVNGNGTTVAEKLGLDSEVRELKFGSSFNTGNRSQQGASAFHTIRYDFKPASVDTSKMATMEVGPSGQVTISMPHYDKDGTTVFKGPTRPYSKECVLIIDKDTGEFVLEKLNHNVQVKKTRQERPEGATRNSSKSVAPPPAADIRPSSLSIQSEQKSPPRKEEKNKRPSSSNNSSSSSQQQHAHSLNSAAVRRRPNSPMTSARHSPVGPPGHHSPSYGNNGSSQQASASNAFDSLVNSKHHQTQSYMPSLTSIEDLLITPPVQNPPVPAVTKAPAIPKTSSSSNSSTIKHTKNPSDDITNALSESSSGESSSSSSSEDDDDDSSSLSDMEEVPDKIPIPPVMGSREKAGTPPVQMTMSMPSFLSLGNQASKPTPPTMSMPSHLLSEDLQLSESGSDSD